MVVSLNIFSVTWKGTLIMKFVSKLFRDLHEDKSGVSFIEYTALLGVILAVGLATLTGVGTWAGLVWTKLCTSLNANSGTACSAA